MISEWIHNPVLSLLAVTVLVINIPYGRLRAAAPRRSHNWFGCLAAPLFFLFSLRHALAISWLNWMPLLAAQLAGQFLGRRMGRNEDQPSPARWRFAVYTAIVGGLLLLAVTPAHADSNWNRLDADEPAPLFTLTDQDGKRAGLADFRGKALVLIFMYTQCKFICPTMPQILARVDNWLTKAERAKVRFVGVSIDPLHDTPERLREFMKKYDLSPARWTLMTGSADEVAGVVSDYGVVAIPDAQGDIVHNAVYVLIDPQGRLRVEFHGLFSPTEEIVKSVRTLIAAPSGKMSKLGDMGKFAQRFANQTNSTESGFQQGW